MSYKVRLSQKREAWNAVQQHTPVIVATVNTLGQRFRIAGVSVKCDGALVAAWGAAVGHE